MTKNSLSDLDVRHALTNLIHDTRDICAKDSRKVLNEDAEILHLVVNRIDCDDMVSDENLSGLWLVALSGSHTQSLTLSR
jgi:hypothetical protein